MKKLLLLVSIVISNPLNYKSQILKKTFYDYQKTQPNEVYYINSQGQYNGLFTKYDWEGAKAAEVNFTNGLKNGVGKEYYTRNGKSKLKISANYKNDQKHGTWITYTYVKNGESFYEIQTDFTSSTEDVFNTGIQVKYKEEIFDKGDIVKETEYHITGKPFYTANFQDRRYTGDYICYNVKNTIIAKGKIGPNGKMVGTWIIPRENSGKCPEDKHYISKVAYTQKIKFDDNGNLDTNFYNKTYYLSGKLKDSVKVLLLNYESGYDWNGIWFFCGPNKIRSGIYREFFESGKLKTEGKYALINGLETKVGIWKSFDENGTLLNEENEDLKRQELDSAKKEAERIEKERIEMEAAKKEAERLEKERIEKERVEMEVAKKEAERLEKERIEKEVAQKEAERIEKERIEMEAAKKEAERLEKERIEKENAKKEAERIEKEELQRVILKADSCVQKENQLFTEFENLVITKSTSPPAFSKYTLEPARNGYVYVVSKKPNLYAHFKEIQTEFIKKLEVMKNEENALKFNGPTAQRISLNNEIIKLSLTHSNLNNKMIQIASGKTSKFEKLIDEAKTTEEKIKILENFQVEP
jgi:antitoxin component YwqK of YwqJK toxin-antitoxin module